MSEDIPITVSISFGDEEEARRMAAALVESRLAACAQLHAIESVYVWEGRTERAAETLLVAKTLASRWSDLERFVASQHSYEVPEILAQPVSHAHGPYLAWMREVLERA